jgi:hypothetical protein
MRQSIQQQTEGGLLQAANIVLMEMMMMKQQLTVRRKQTHLWGKETCFMFSRGYSMLRELATSDNLIIQSFPYIQVLTVADEARHHPLMVT